VDLVVELVVEEQVEQEEQEIHPLSLPHKVKMVEVLLPLVQITLQVEVVEQLKQELQVDQVDQMEVEEVEQEQRQILQEVQQLFLVVAVEVQHLIKTHQVQQQVLVELAVPVDHRRVEQLALVQQIEVEVQEVQSVLVTHLDLEDQE
tara:strand:+ start:132 stop:572 length:441 start_codon:yes stop_codon:yes gene_type:complete